MSGTGPSEDVSEVILLDDVDREVGVALELREESFRLPEGIEKKRIHEVGLRAGQFSH
ncbi:protein of unknown function [Denitratisoma oestradiolicum]|uniref:Uncharacterized protein n=1 Tax=Denitratisoma oestradiolicum TaxID=311182 RepID=A0A6S6YLF8_9PROT|nr:protein of unknown function [Denitratisoma oestradiolicum]